MIFGDFDSLLGTQTPDLNFAVSRIMYSLFTFFISLILLNLLIALMGNSYSKIDQKSETAWRVEFTALIVDIEENYFWIRHLTRVISNLFAMRRFH